MRNFDRGPRRDSHRGGFRRNFGPREMHKATCADCGKECEVPFKPIEDRPVYCKDCFMKRKGITPREEPAEEQEESEEQPEKSDESTEEVEENEEQ